MRLATRLVTAVTAAALALTAAACTASHTAGGSSAASSSSSSAPSTPSTSGAPTSGASVTVAPPAAGSAPATAASSAVPASGSTGPSSSAPSAATSTPPPTPKPATVITSPKLGATDISPRQNLTISASGGTLQDIKFVNVDSGTAVKGQLSGNKSSWTLSEPLGYSATYKVTGTAVNSAGQKTNVSGRYTTVTPDEEIHASISPSDGDTVGIGAPILISLGTDITDPAARARIEKAITVTTSPKTVGSFAWIQHDDGWGLDWRPKAYWKSGTKVSVTANLYGVDFGGNLWGETDLKSSFTIGRAEIVKGDINTHRLKVYVDGKLKYNFPTSYGLESDPGRVTRGGTYIVMGKEYLHLMSNPAYHYFNFKAYYAVRISNNGTFIHANDGTDDVQGYENVTHGCANLSMVNAETYYDQALYGDPVEITGSSIPLSQSDGDIYDWTIPWSTWVTLSALHKAPSGSTQS